MGKSKDKKGRGNAETTASDSKPAAPELSKDAVASLTAKIQSGLQNLNGPAKGKGKPEKKGDSKGRKNEGFKDKNAGKKPRSEQSNEKGQQEFGRRQGHSLQPQDTAFKGSKNDSSRGTKRQRDGEAKPQHSRPFAPPQRQNPKPRGKAVITEEEILKEILELGGSKEDLDIVKDAGLESDDDEIVKVPNGGKADANVQSELERFMSSIGLDTKVSKKAAIIPDEAEEDSEDDEHEEDEEEEESEAEPEPVKKPSKKEKEKAKKAKEQEPAPEPEKATKTEGKTVTIEEPKKEYPKYPGVGEHKGDKLLFEPRPDWHELELPPLNPNASAPSKETVASLKSRGEALLKMESDLYSNTHLTKSSDRKFLATVMSSGTLSDKISALTLVCQESPLHTRKTLESLLGLAKKKSRSQAVAAMAAIKDLFGSGSVLPPGRKLKYFGTHPGLGDKAITDMHLLVWVYEDWLKTFYFDVLKVLEELSSDQLPFARSHAVSAIAELLKEKPEQEANLLRLLVNKLGDLDKKVASKVSYLLLQLQVTHPAMTPIVIHAIESEVLLKPGQSIHALYYAVITLNQTVLTTRNVDVPNKLIDIYFDLFTRLLYKNRNKKDEPEDKRTIKEKVKSHEESTGTKMSRKARARKMKEEQDKALEEETNSKLVSAILTGVNRAFPYSKVSDDIFERHMNTLFQITHSSNFNTSIQALLLIFQVSSSKQFVTDRFYRVLYESLFDPRLVNSSKQAMYLNLLYKALKADLKINRVKAFMKRLVQICTMHQPAFVSGVLYLLSELQQALPSLTTMITTPENDDDDEEEVFRDVPDEDDAAAEDRGGVSLKQKPDNSKDYLPRQPDPLAANAESVNLWELLPFRSHFHPTISMYAESLIECKKLETKPDLGHHTLSHFLDRFVYRTPKANPNAPRGQSIMQPLVGTFGKTGLVVATKRDSAAPVNSEDFWTRKESEIGEDEVFFHRYFNQKAEVLKKKADKKKKRKTGRLGSDEEDEEEGSEDENEIWEALVKSRPELEVDEDGAADFSDDDVDFDDEDLDMSDATDAMSDVSETAGPTFEEEASDAWESEEELPESLDKLFAAEAAKDKAEPEEEEEDAGASKKKKRKLKHLPTFASAEDYAHLMSDSE